MHLSGNSAKISEQGIVVLPFPQKIKVGEKRIALAGKVTIINKVPGEVTGYAASRLSRELTELVGVDAAVMTQADKKATLIIELALKPFKPEGYRIETKESDGVLTYVVEGNDTSGILYGTYTIRQIIHSASAAAEKPVAPTMLAVEDWPTMVTRLLPTEIYTFPENDPQAKEKVERLDWSSLWRFNGFWINLTGAPSRSIAPVTADELMRISALAKQRGMTLYGALTFLSVTEIRGIDSGMCPENKETLSYMKGLYEKAFKNGCGGLALQFDDLTPQMEDHHLRCPQCKNRFHSIAEWQSAFIQQMAEEARAYGIEKLIVCPTPYGRDKADMPRYKDYYKVLCAPDFMKDVLVFHCEILPDKVAHLKELGLKNYIWYDNGLWPSQMYHEGNYMGISKLHHIWYGHQAAPEDAVAPVPGIYEALRNFESFCTHVYPSPTGSDVSRAMGGCLGWNPRQSVDEQPLMRKTLVGSMYGRGSWDEYLTWETNMSAWFAVYRSNPLGIDVSKATAQMNTAEKALERLLSLSKAARGLGAALPYLRTESAQTLVQMRETIVKARESLKAPSLPPPLEHVSLSAVPEGILFTMGFDAFSGDRFLDSAAKERYGIFRGSVPVLKRGVVNNAAYFNGKDNNIVMPASTTADLNPGKASFSVECWVFMMGQWWNSFIDKRGSTRYIYRKPGWALGSDRQGNTWRFTLEDTQEKNVTLSYTTNDMLYRWHHLAAVRDTASKMVYFYVDGELRAKDSDPTADVTNAMPLIIGKDTMVGGGYWGLLDNVTYWDRALTAADVKDRALHQDAMK